MRLILHSSSFYIIGAAILIICAIVLLFSFFKSDTSEQIIAVADVGTVRETVSVSGVVEAENKAELAFPTTGIVQAVNVDEGDQVESADILIALDARALLADRQEAVAVVAKTQADLDELLAVPRNETRVLSMENVRLKEAALEQAIRNEDQKVTNARRTLLSSGLSAYTEDDTDSATAPTITGTYTCDVVGSYYFDIYSSAAQSGYSMRVTGLETGTHPVATDQPAVFGTCGLRAQFSASTNYGNSEWIIDIPNQKDSSYTTNKNAYELALAAREQAITLAEQDLALAQATANSDTAPARAEDVAQARAVVAEAQARLVRIDANIADRTLTAPFAGTITNVAVLPGETVTTAPVVTVLANNTFELTARVPEIDIGKILVGQRASIVFDARMTETLEAVIDYVSPTATEIDGVAYYDARLVLDETPEWLKSGLNADIDIVVNQVIDAIRLPKRFVSTDAAAAFVLLPTGTDQQLQQQTIMVDFIGNDGFVAISGLEAGTTVVAP